MARMLGPDRLHRMNTKLGNVNEILNEMTDVTQQTVPEQITKTAPVAALSLVSLDGLKLSVRAADCLNHAGIKTVGELATKTDADLLRIGGFGRRALKEVRKVLSSYGLDLGMEEKNPDNLHPTALSETTSSKTEILARSVYDLDLTVRAANLLHRAGIKTMGELVTKKEEELRKKHRFNTESLKEIKEILLACRLYFGMENPNEELFSFSWPIERLLLSTRATNILRDAGIKTVGDLVTRTKKEVQKIKGLGKKSLYEIKAALDVTGLDLGMQLPVQ